MSEKIKPALTSEEWRRGLTEYPANQPGKTIRDSDGVFENADAATCHYIAALALYGQTFGFTREDVRTLRIYSAVIDGQRNGNFASLADRIEALLPPEETK